MPARPFTIRPSNIFLIIICSSFLAACATQNAGLRKVTGGLYAGYMPFGNKKPNAQPEYHAFAQQLYEQIAQVQQNSTQLLDGAAMSIAQARRALQQFQSIKATLLARLQMGSTPNNPALQNLLHEAQAHLTQMEVLIASLARLEGDAKISHQKLLDLSQAAQSALDLPGAVEADSAALRSVRAQALIAAVPLSLLRKDLQNYGQNLAPNITQERSQMRKLAQAVSAGQWFAQDQAPTQAHEFAQSRMGMARHTATRYSAATPGIAQSDANGLSIPQTYHLPPPQARPTNYNAQSLQDLALQDLGLRILQDTSTPAISDGAIVGLAPTPPANSHAVVPRPLAVTAIAPSGPAFVVIRFHNDIPNYEAQLAQAIAAVKERCPTSAFTIAAAIPHHKLDTDARALANRHARHVARTLQTLDVPPQKIALAPSQISNVTNSEVHIYLR